MKKLRRIKEFINNVRQNIHSYLRKEQLFRNTNPALVKHLKPTVSCKKKWYGSSYGGFYINPDLLTNNSIIYSFGIGKDISFDMTCSKHHQASIYAFDPTPKSITWIKEQKLPTNFHFFDFGIAVGDKEFAEFYLPKNTKSVSGSTIQSDVFDSINSIKLPMKSFSKITEMLLHTHIDVLKIDIEGSEYEVLEDILESKITINQLLIEFHDRLFDTQIYKSVEIVKKLNEAGFNIFGCSKSFEEVSFIHSSAALINNRNI